MIEIGLFNLSTLSVSYNSPLLLHGLLESWCSKPRLQLLTEHRYRTENLSENIERAARAAGGHSHEAGHQVPGFRQVAPDRSIDLALAMAAALLLLLLVMVSQLSQCAIAQFPAALVDGFLRPQNIARAQLRLPPLQWDARLANYAQGWANQRRAYGDCRLKHSGGPYGENIFWGAGKAWQPAEAASAWVNERQWYRYYSNSCVYYNKCGHYTQVVWRGTTRVGCGRSVCNDGNVFMTCNYYPPGNWVGQRPY